MTSVEEIGAHAGMSRGAVNHGFGSKAKLLQVLLTEHGEAWAAISREARAAPEPTSAGELIDAHWAPWVAEPTNPRLLLMLIYEGLGPSHELRPGLAALRERLQRYGQSQIAELQAAGHMPRDVDPGEAMRVITSAMLGMLAEAAFDDDLDLSVAYAQVRGMFDERWPPVATAQLALEGERA